MARPPAALIIGPGVLVHGQNGVIGYNGNFAGSSNVTFTNQGTINADTAGGTLTLDGNNWTNSGTIQGSNGGSLILTTTVATAPAWTSGTALSISGGGALTLNGNNWTSAGVTMTNATLNLGDTFTFADLGTFTRSGGTVNVTGTLTNTATTLNLNSVNGSWQLLGGTIDGGTVTTTGGNALIGTSSSGALVNAVKLNGILNLTGPNRANMTVSGGLTLVGGSVIQIGGTNNFDSLSFDGSQTLGGTGSVDFGSGLENVLRVGPTAGAALIIGPNVLVHGQNGVIGYDGNFAGSSNVTFTNQGTINADTAGGTLTLDANNITNTGTMGVIGNSSLVLVNSVSSDQSGVVYSHPGATITAQGNLVGSTKNADQYAPEGAVTLAGSGTAAVASVARGHEQRPRQRRRRLPEELRLRRTRAGQQHLRQAGG